MSPTTAPINTSHAEFKRNRNSATADATAKIIVTTVHTIMNWGHGMPVFTKRPTPKESGNKEFLDAFGQEYPAYENADQ